MHSIILISYEIVYFLIERVMILRMILAKLREVLFSIVIDILLSNDNILVHKSVENNDKCMF